MAKRPPSSGTSGRSSGGMTGIIFMIIHSGLFTFLEERNASTTCRRFKASVLRIWLESLLARSRSSKESLSRPVRPLASSMVSSWSRSRMASAPILAMNLLGSESSRRSLVSLNLLSTIFRYSSSERRSSRCEPLRSSPVSGFFMPATAPGWMTMYFS